MASPTLQVDRIVSLDLKAQRSKSVFFRLVHEKEMLKKFLLAFKTII